MKPTKIIVRNPVYPVVLAVWIGPWNTAGVEALGQRAGIMAKGVGLEPIETDGACHNFGSGSLIYLRYPPVDFYGVGTMAHEITHAIANAGSALGFKLTADSDEFYAYLAGFWTREILKRVRR